MPSKKDKASALAKLQAVILMLETRNMAGSVSPAVLGHANGLVNEAMELLKKADPERREVELVVTILRNSTEVRTAFSNGMDHEHVWVKDRELYNWAVKKAHSLISEGEDL